MPQPYVANPDRSISYLGNNLFPPIKDISKVRLSKSEFADRVKVFNEKRMWPSITRINHRIAMASNNYFDDRGALFIPSPLITRMISSPGAVYGKDAIDYTSDTCPITLQWFDLPNLAFLSESSQIYLEMALSQEGIKETYSISNSFRKERADATHLSEFHHIEYEGQINQRENESVALGLVGKIIKDLVRFNYKDLEVFLDSHAIDCLNTWRPGKVQMLTFRDALNELYKDTRDEKYKFFTMANFGPWEEIRLTQIIGGPIGIREFPLLEVPFYHAPVDNKEPAVADNTDFIWEGYREFIGTGHRVRSKEELEAKAILFNLPDEDYAPYLQTRASQIYKESSGFGLGWERFLQGLLQMPFIWSAVHFPRVDTTLAP